MTNVMEALDQAEVIERKLRRLTEDLADHLHLPASQRDSGQIAAHWSAIDRLRPKMQAVGATLRKAERPVRSRLKAAEYRSQRPRYEMARDVLRRLRDWDEIGCIVKRHQDPVRTPLLVLRPPRRQDPLLTQIYEALHRLANPATQDPAAYTCGSYADIALPIAPFDLLMSAAYRVGLARSPRRALRFLDVGCGGGTKVFAATRYFAQADGLELDPGYADAARRTLNRLGPTRSEIIKADALCFDRYADYDVIYFYRPLKSDLQLAELERRILETARPGTILVAPHDAALAARPGMVCTQLEGPIFVTGLTPPEAIRLKQDAEATGIEILSRSAHRSFDTGHWAPILDAASFGAGP